MNKAYLLKIRGGVEVDSYGKKAGKGPLIQEEVSATLGTNQDQYLFQPIGVDIYNFSVTGEKSRCLSTSGGGLNEHIPVVIESALPILDDQGGSRISVRMDGKAPTLRAETHGNLPCVLLASENIAGTLDSHYWKGQGEREGVERTFVVVMKGEIPASHEDDCEGNEVFYEAYQHHGWRESVVAGTLTADQNNGVRGDTPVIVMATQQGGAEIAVNLCPTITAAAGMSGNNQPVVCIEGHGSRPSHFEDGYKESDVMYTLNTIDRHAVAYESNKP